MLAKKAGWLLSKIRTLVWLGFGKENFFFGKRHFSEIERSIFFKRSHPAFFASIMAYLKKNRGHTQTHGRGRRLWQRRPSTEHFLLLAFQRRAPVRSMRGCMRLGRPTVKQYVSDGFETYCAECYWNQNAGPGCVVLNGRTSRHECRTLSQTTPAFRVEDVVLVDDCHSSLREHVVRPSGPVPPE